MKNKILMIIARYDFSDQQYAICRDVFERAGFDIKTASLSRGEAIGAFGSVIDVDLALSEIKAGDFCATVFADEGRAVLADGQVIKATKDSRKFAEEIVRAIDSNL